MRNRCRQPGNHLYSDGDLLMDYDVLLRYAPLIHESMHIPNHPFPFSNPRTLAQSLYRHHLFPPLVSPTSTASCILPYTKPSKLHHATLHHPKCPNPSKNPTSFQAWLRNRIGSLVDSTMTRMMIITGTALPRSLWGLFVIMTMMRMRRRMSIG